MIKIIQSTVLLFLLMHTISLSQTLLPNFIYGKYILKDTTEYYYVKGDLSIEKNGALILEPGTKLIMDFNKSIHVYGELLALGQNDKSSIIIQNHTKDNYWNSIILFPGSKAIINNTTIKNGQIYGDSTQLFIDSTLFYNETKLLELPLIYIKHSIFEFLNSEIINNNTGNGIVIEDSKNVRVENSNFLNCPDPIEYSYVKGGIIKNNNISLSNDDGIDINASENIIIKYNQIFEVSDKGISIGNSNETPSKNITIERNIMYKCFKGISLKGGIEVDIKNCNFYQNSIGVECFEKENGTGGAIAHMINCIFENVNSFASIDEKSNIDYKYCLSTDKEIYGENNIIGKTHFVSVESLDFHITYKSDCIDKGDPASDLDPDSTRADIGVFYFNQRIPKIVINEINYNSGLTENYGDWIELYNNDIEAKDLSKVEVKLNNTTIAIFPKNTILDKNSYLIIVSDSTKYLKKFDFCTPAKLIFKADLPKYGQISIFDSTNRLIDEVIYSNQYPWDSLSDGYGHSLELINPNFDNTIPTNWLASTNLGTPCKINSVFTDSLLFVEDNNYKYFKEFESIIVYPNPASRNITIKCLNYDYAGATVSLYSLLGAKIEIIKQDFTTSNSNSQLIILPDDIQTGTYFLIIEKNSLCKIIQLLIIH